MYLYYSVLFAGAYTIGAAYILNYVFHISPMLVTLGITLPAFTFLVLGVKPSAKYALYAGLIEIVVMGLFFAVSSYLAHFTFYSPIAYPGATNIGVGKIALAILFAMGIPGGFNAIAPISGEVINPEKTIGRAAVSVILIGGALAALFIYGLVNLLVHLRLSIYGVSSGGGLAVINYVTAYFGVYGKYFVLAFAVGAVSDGILAILSFDAAASRTLFKMSVDGTVPSFLSLKRNGRPVVSDIVSGLAAISIPLLMLSLFSPSSSFIALGLVSALGGLFIQLSAGFSLFRVSLRRVKRKMFNGISSLRSVFSVYGEITIAVAAVVVTGGDMILSMYSTALYYTTFFLVWIVIGYLVTDIREIGFKAASNKMLARGAGSNSLWQRAVNLTAKDIQSELPDVTVQRGDPLRVALDQCVKMDSPAAIVIGSDNRPIGTLLLMDIIQLGDKEMSSAIVDEYYTPWIAMVTLNEKAMNLAEVFSQSGLPILAIVDENGKFVGTLREKELVR